MTIIANEEILGGPFNSTRVVDNVNGIPVGDKAVNAAFLASMASCFISDGIVRDRGEEFAVYPAGDMSIAVSPGCAWGNGYMAKSDEEVYFELESGREYTVFLRFNGAEGTASLMVCEENRGMIPLRNASICDLVLAEISSPVDISEFTDLHIEDTRADKVICGYASLKS